MSYSLGEYLNPWTCARILFEPETADRREPFQMLSDWRARIGAVFIIVLSIRFEAWHDLVWRFVTNASINLLAGSVFAAAAVGVYWVTSPGGLSPTNRHFTRRALIRAVASMAVTATMWFVLKAGVIAIPLLGLVVALWLIVFALRMLWLCLRWVFGVSEANKLLGPIVTALTALAAVGFDRVSDDPDPRPAQLQLLIKLGALATVLLLAVGEFFWVARRLRSSPAPGLGHPLLTPSWAGHGHVPLPRNTMAVASLVTAFLVWPVVSPGWSVRTSTRRPCSPAATGPGPGRAAPA